MALGSGIGGLTTIEDGHKTLLNDGPNKISPFFVPGSIMNKWITGTKIASDFE